MPDLTGYLIKKDLPRDKEARFFTWHFRKMVNIYFLFIYRQVEMFQKPTSNVLFRDLPLAIFRARLIP